MAMETRYIDANIERAVGEGDVEKTRTVRFTVSTATRDRHKTVLNMDNWQLDNYKRNPIVGYQHEVYGSFFTQDTPDTVVGKAEAWIEDRKLMADVTFEPREINELAEKVFRKVLFGTLRATSVGFLPIGEGRTEKKVDDKGRELDRTFYFDGQELLEFSIVKIPSNPDAVRKSHGHSILKEIARRVPAFEVEELEKMTLRQVLDIIEYGKFNAVPVEVIEKEIEKQKGGDPSFYAYKNQLNKWTN